MPSTGHAFGCVMVRVRVLSLDSMECTKRDKKVLISQMSLTRLLVGHSGSFYVARRLTGVLIEEL